MPQGSILGPLLFLSYIDDMRYCSDIVKFILFADDTTIFYSSRDLNDLFNTMNNELSKLSEWLKVNKLSINIKKTHYIIFGSRPVDPADVNLTFNGIPLENVQSTKFLGVIIDSKLTWKAHIQHIVNKLSKISGVIYKLRYLLNSKTTLLLYDAMVVPYLTYCAIVWAAAPKTTLNRLHLLQKRVLRLVVLAVDYHHLALFSKSLNG